MPVPVGFGLYSSSRAVMWTVLVRWIVDVELGEPVSVMVVMVWL